MARPSKSDPVSQRQNNPGTTREQAVDPHKKKQSDKVNIEGKASPTKPQRVQGANVNRPGSRG